MKKIPIWKNVILIVSVLVIIMVATFAWFVTGLTDGLVELSTDVGEASFIQISDDHGNNWSEELDVEFGVNNNIKELSGSGESLYAPVYDAVEQPNGGFATEIVAFEQVNEAVKYYEQVIEFRSDSNHDVYLAQDSFVSAVNNQANSYIEGAIRVAFFELDENGRETLKCIWAPNSTIEYSASTNSFTKEGTVEANYYYQKTGTVVDPDTLEDDATNDHVAKISTGDPSNPDEMPVCGYDAEHKFMWSSGNTLPENAPALLTFHLDDEDGLGYKTMKVKVWLEGHDRECVSQVGGQRFTMRLLFNVNEGE